uniref:Secreted protein n=1 Tax=Setaria viridis TaxID=4556 RepID=A0A4U6SS40_SETVI|nr:hypothetical protein SEVIR_9G055732v2 [Setaria viridis]
MPVDDLGLVLVLCRICHFVPCLLPWFASALACPVPASAAAESPSSPRRPCRTQHSTSVRLARQAPPRRLSRWPSYSYSCLCLVAAAKARTPMAACTDTRRATASPRLHACSPATFAHGTCEFHSTGFGRSLASRP